MTELMLELIGGSVGIIASAICIAILIYRLKEDKK